MLVAIKSEIGNEKLNENKHQLHCVQDDDQKEHKPAKKDDVPTIMKTILVIVERFSYLALPLRQ